MVALLDLRDRPIGKEYPSSLGMSHTGSPTDGAFFAGRLFRKRASRLEVRRVIRAFRRSFLRPGTAFSFSVCCRKVN